MRCKQSIAEQCNTNEENNTASLKLDDVWEYETIKNNPDIENESAECHNRLTIKPQNPIYKHCLRV